MAGLSSGTGNKRAALKLRMNDLSANFSDAAPLSEWTGWTPERDAELIRLWALGKSATQISREMDCGISRNAVIGRWHRLGLADRNRSMPVAIREPRRIRVKPKPASPAISLATKPAVTAGPLPCAPVALPPAPQGPGISLVALTSTACHWPLNDGGPYLFCGAPKDGVGPYCEYHARIAYQPLPVRKPDGAARFRVGPARAAVR